MISSGSSSSSRMMSSCTLQLIIFLVVYGLALTPGCSAYKPLLHPNVPELLINEGEPLEITCTSISEINVFYPEDDEVAGVTTSEHHITTEHDEIGGSVKVKFRRPETVFGDTGWYGCADSKAQVTSKDYNDPSASWIYVYVKSNASSFVETKENRGIRGILGESIVLPCRTTSPDLHVDLESEEKVFKLDENLSYDPKIGFTLKNVTAQNSGMFTCGVNQNEDELTFFVTLVRKDSMKPPKIIEDGLQHVTAGSNLRVKCTVSIGVDDRYKFYWETPRNSTSRTILPSVERKIDPHTILVTSELVEDRVTYDDEGEYVCRVKSLIDMKNTSVYIHVYDPSIKYIRLTSHDDSRYYMIRAFKPVTFSAQVDAYPTPTLVWFDPHGNELISGNGIIIENTNTSSTLKIKSVGIENMGVYTLQASNDADVERLNFTVEVLAKPLAMLDTTQFAPYYVLNETAKFVCQAAGNPKPEVSLYYSKCPKLPSMDDCETTELTDIEKKDESVVRIDVSGTTTVEMSGIINCTACNEYGCDSVQQNILVSDGETGSAFEIIEPKNDITVGDNVTVTCVASNYNFSSVMWYEGNEELVKDSERVRVTIQDTDFTHRAILSIYDVRQSDRLFYVCRATTIDSNADYNELDYEIKLAAPEKPYFTKVNMNGSEVTISSRESLKGINLLCYVKGMPKPNVTWYKDGKPLEFSNEQFNLSSNNQELVMKYLLEKDSGKYECVAENRFGVIRQYQNFIVKGPKIPMNLIATVVGVILVLVILLIYFCIKVRREKRMRKQLLEAGLMHFEEGALDCINPELTVDDQAELLPYDRKWEFPREKLKLGKQLGSGAFGVVMKAQAYGILADESITTVAVKMVRRNAEPAYIRALASELKIMVHLGKHLNVVNLLGACTNNIAKRELLVIVEYCRFGNLHNYLLRHRESFIDQIDRSTDKIDPSIGKEFLMRSTSVGSNKRVKYAALSFSRSLSTASSNNYNTATTAETHVPGTETVVYVADTQDLVGIPEHQDINSNGSQPGWRSNYRGDYKDRNLKPICTQDLLSWAFQVARGMEYLSKRKVLHGDLAARNILLAENNVVKICDFGLAKTMYKDDNYKKQGNGPVPIKWMAIESIRDRVFSTQSDIWSFGVVLWEFFTLAETPYPGMQAEKQYQKLVEGYRMEKPKYATKDIYDIMLDCWKSKPTQRPSFTELVDNIGELLEEGVKMHYVELNNPYLDLNTSGLEGKNDYLTMMSAPDHAVLASPQHDYINSSSPKATDSAYLSMSNGSPLACDTRFQFTANPTNTQHSDGEDSPMLKKTDAPIKPEPEQDDDNYLKPIDVHKKREQFMKQREAERKREMEESRRRSSERQSSDRDSGYCNAPKNLDAKTEIDTVDKPGVILMTRDNYVNMPQQKNEVRKDVGLPDSFVNPSFMNPSYIFVESAKPDSNRPMF